MAMSMSNAPDTFRQTGWPGIRARLFHLYFVLRRPMTLGARGIVYDREANAVFLIEHTYAPGWQLPGGGVETGETMLEALSRELSEEGNIDLTGAPQLVSIHHNRHASRRDHVGLYLVTEFHQAAPKTPDHEIRNAGFFALDKLPADTTPGTLRRIDEVLKGVERSPYW